MLCLSALFSETSTLKAAKGNKVAKKKQLGIKGTEDRNKPSLMRIFYEKKYVKVQLSIDIMKVTCCA